MWLLNPLRRSQLYNDVSDTYKKIKSTDCLLLQLLIMHQGEVVSKETIINYVWQGRIVSDSSLTQAIALLRLTLGDNGKEQKIIKTFPRKGYMLLPNFVQLDERRDTNSNHQIKTGSSPELDISIFPESDDYLSKGQVRLSDYQHIGKLLLRKKDMLFKLILALSTIAATASYVWVFNLYHHQKITVKQVWHQKKRDESIVFIDDNLGSTTLYQALKGGLSDDINYLFISKNLERYYISCIYDSDRLKEDIVLNLTFPLDLSFSEIEAEINEQCR